MAEPLANSEMSKTEFMTSEQISNSCGSGTEKKAKELASDIHCPVKSKWKV